MGYLYLFNCCPSLPRRRRRCGCRVTMSRRRSVSRSVGEWKFAAAAVRRRRRRDDPSINHSLHSTANLLRLRHSYTTSSWRHRRVTWPPAAALIVRTAAVKKKKYKVKYTDIAVRTCHVQLRELTCHIGAHSVTYHLTEVTFPPLPQPKLVLD